MTNALTANVLINLYNITNLTENFYLSIHFVNKHIHNLGNQLLDENKLPTLVHRYIDNFTLPFVCRQNNYTSTQIHRSPHGIRDKCAGM